MKFIDSRYNHYNGSSKVILRHLGQLFEGWAKLNPEDEDKASEYAGCAYAEQRAYIKALKYERKLAKEEAEVCRKFIKACSSTKAWDPTSPSAKVAYHQLNVKIKKVNKLADMINAAEKSLQQSIWTRDVTIKAFRENKQKRLNDKAEF